MPCRDGTAESVTVLVVQHPNSAQTVGCQVKPVLQALVVADRVYEDRNTGKKIIAGTFNRFWFSKAPPVREVQLADGTKLKQIPGGMHGGSPYAYICLVDVCKDTKLSLHFVNLTKNTSLFTAQLEVSSPDRLQPIEVVLPLPPLPIQEPGTYALEVVCEGEILGSWRITAEELQLKSE